MVTTSHSDNYTGYALTSFFEHTTLEPSDRFILFDNDRSFTASSVLDAHPEIEVVRNESPRSFAANINAALAEARLSEGDLYFLNNDLIFSANWLPPLEEYRDAIVLPVSNVEFSYQAGPLQLEPTMDLVDYLGKERYFDAIASAHCARHVGFRPHLRPAYFCVKIPRNIYLRVGDFDESFGPGGAEDTDYCIRAFLAGFRIGHVLNSFVLHFHGKSTWRGPEKPEDTQARNDRYIAAFRDKWGEDLTRLFLFSDRAPLAARPGLSQSMAEGDIGSVIRHLRAT